MFYYVTPGSNVMRDVFYQQIENGNIANQIRGFTIDYGKVILNMYLYNNPSYSRILIGSCLWSIRGQTHDWRHHFRVFASAVLRIGIIFYVTGQKIRYKKVLPKHWTGSRSQKTKIKSFSSSLSRQSSETKPRTNLLLVSREPLLYLEFNKPNKQNVSEITR